MESLPVRKDVQPQYTYDLASLFPNQPAWEASFREIEACLETVKTYQGRLGESPQILADWLQFSQDLNQKVLKNYLYALLAYSVDATNQENAALVGRMQGLLARVQAALSFAEPELLSIGTPNLLRLVAENPQLSLYAHYFDQLEQRSAHVRSPEVEEVLGQVQDPFETASATHSILVNADLTFRSAHGSGSPRKPAVVTHSTMRSLQASTDRKLRESSWKSYADGHLAFRNTMANCLVAGYKQDVLKAKVRGYATSVEAALSENDIPAGVYTNVVEAFKANVSTWHRYWNLRRRVYGLRKLRVYDTYATLGEKPMDIPYEQAVDWIVDGLRPLGEDYTAILRRGATQERWVDSAMNQGKRFGAFSAGMKDAHPFIMMSYDRSIYSVSTLAHELGHSMHSYYSGENQPYIYSGYGLFAAEVASNFNQAMVRAHLLKTFSDREFRLAVLQEAMSNFYRYFFTMPVLAMFDLEVHQRVERGEALNAEILNSIMAGLLQTGYGPNVAVDPERDGCLWAQFSTHLYSNYYTYQYTTGISGAHALVPGVLSGSIQARDNYRAFLRAGSSIYPVDALKLAGVDLTQPDPIQQTFQVLSGYVDQLEDLLGK